MGETLTYMKIVANNELCAIYKLVLLLGLFLLKWSTALEHCGLCVVNLLWCFWAILLKALPFGFEHWDLGDVTDILATWVETLFQGSILMVYPISNAISVKAEFSQIALKSSFQNLPISAPRLSVGGLQFGRYTFKLPNYHPIIEQYLWYQPGCLCLNLKIKLMTAWFKIIFINTF